MNIPNPNSSPNNKINNTGNFNSNINEIGSVTEIETVNEKETKTVTASTPIKTIREAYEYLKLVRIQLQVCNRHEVYGSFLEIMRRFKEQSMERMEVIERVAELFAGHDQLLYGFNQFLPKGYRLEPFSEGGCVNVNVNGNGSGSDDDDDDDDEQEDDTVTGTGYRLVVIVTPEGRSLRQTKGYGHGHRRIGGRIQLD